MHSSPKSFLVAAVAATALCAMSVTSGAYAEDIQEQAAAIEQPMVITPSINPAKAEEADEEENVGATRSDRDAVTVDDVLTDLAARLAENNAQPGSQS